MKAWILVFLFNGVPMASGPHDLEGCMVLAQDQQQAHCWNTRTQERKKP